MPKWISLPLACYEDGGSPSRDERAIMDMCDGDVRRVRLAGGTELDAVWDDRRYFRPCDSDGSATSEDGLDVVAVQALPDKKHAFPGATIPEAERRARGQRELHLRIDQDTVTRIGELCDDAGPGTTRAAVIQALVARAHGAMVRGRLNKKHASK
jgi:hypothetical protein